ncbi:putative inactive receptor kinase At2g26730 [Curcuma longa]|uniref:putative inactive receptor kinase At2g26730 n=1 Tax=Curcuma longa TaxID=136217 RepID=UPI003D9DE80F
MEHLALLFFLFLFFSSVAGESDDVRKSLIRFLEKLSPNDPQLAQRLGWDASTDPCNGGWRNLSCNDKKMEVRAVTLEGMGLNGTIDAGELCRAPSLAVVRLQDNFIGGILPAEISNCTGLMHLYLGNNQLVGGLPSSLADLGNLKVLDLSDNNFSGELPALSRISGLSGFLVQNNNLNGSIPGFWFRNFGAGYFNVSYNQFAGPIPEGAEDIGAAAFLGNHGLCGRPLPNACSPPSPSSSPSPSPAGKKDDSGTREKLILFSGYIALGLFLLPCAAYRVLRKKKATRNKIEASDSSSPKSSFTMNKSVASRSEHPISTESAVTEGSTLVVLKKLTTTAAELKFEELLKAPAELLGRGRFGSVYKVAMPDGAALAVKRLKDSGSSAAEFQRRMVRVDTAARHPNVLPAVAFYCSAQGKLVVYEFQQNGSLLNLLQGSNRTGGGAFDWSWRLRVAAGIAEGLAFMHKELNSEGLVGHGNLKSSNILMNADMDPCISEYGLVVANTGDADAAAKPISRVAGGADKADVYGFGIIILELLTGKPVKNDPLELARWVNSVVREEWTVEVFDKSIVSGGASEERMVQMLQVGLMCVNPSANARPSMDQVASMINAVREEDERSLLVSVSETSDPPIAIKALINCSIAERVFLQLRKKAGKEKEKEKEKEQSQAPAVVRRSIYMGGGKKFPSMSFCGLCFGHPRREAEEATEWEQRRARKVRPSDEDHGRWFGAPDVDEKASDFIARFYASRFTDSERQAIIV